MTIEPSPPQEPDSAPDEEPEVEDEERSEVLKLELEWLRGALAGEEETSGEEASE